MIVLDTNVISELMRARPNEKVVSWVDAQPASGLYVTTISEAEILLGIQLLPKGKRRDAIAGAAREMFESDFGGRSLGFDASAATEYATIVAARRRAGRPISTFDAQIAAIVRSNGADLATRNVDDFASCGLPLIDPWTHDES